MKQIQQQIANEEARRLRDKLKYERKMEEERAKEREILKKRMTAEPNKKQQSEQKKNEHELHKTSEKPVNSTPEESIVVNENFDSEQTNNLEKSNVRETKEFKNEDEISKLEIEVTCCSGCGVFLFPIIFQHSFGYLLIFKSFFHFFLCFDLQCQFVLQSIRLNMRSSVTKYK